MGRSEKVSFAVQASPADAGSWLSLARRVENAGFDTLCIGDHPGTTVSPFVALAAAAPVTSSLRLGTAVLNGGVREPLDIAGDVAALDMVSGGRAVLGLGAGHTPQEWRATGRSYPSPADRIRRLAEMAPLIRQLLAGEVVDHRGECFTLQSAQLEVTPPERVPLLIGGNSRPTVRVGAATADIVEVGGLGRTLADGHFHETRWRPHETDAVVEVVDDGAGSRSPSPVLAALVQMVEVTDDAEGAVDRFRSRLATLQPEKTLPSIDDLLAVPYVLIGTIGEIADQLEAARTRWGFSRFTVREPAMDAVIRVMAELERRRS